MKKELHHISTRVLYHMTMNENNMAAGTAPRKTYTELSQQRMAAIKAAQAAGAVEKKTTIGNWRRMRSVKNEVDSIRQDRDGNLWRSLRVYGVNGIVLQAVDADLLPPLADEVDVKLECGHTVRLHRASSAFDFPNDPLWCPTCGKWVKLHAEVIARIS